MAKKLLNLDTREHEWVLSENEYEYLVERDEFLGALQAAGVDNWEGYDYAVQYHATGEEPW
jgi:hypothetical protein